MTKDEALDLALEALEYFTDTSVSAMDHAVAEDAITAIKQARALDKMAENARELGLDYEPVAPVREDWGPGPHECHSLTAAPVQEPVWIRPDELQKAQKAPFLCRVGPNKRDDFVPLYTTPPAQRQSARSAWVGLTDEEVRETISSVHIEPLFSYRHVARAIEAKLKELNT